MNFGLLVLQVLSKCVEALDVHFLPLKLLKVHKCFYQFTETVAFRLIKAFKTFLHTVYLIFYLFVLLKAKMLSRLPAQNILRPALPV